MLDLRNPGRHTPAFDVEAAMTENTRAELIFYASSEGKVRVEVHHEDGTFWLSQRQLAELFGVDVRTINHHLKQIFESGELRSEATIRNFRMVRTEGDRSVSRDITHYHLDAIISVGYRVNSAEATRFRIWAMATLREFVVKGVVLDDERLKLNRRFGKDYFDELLERIREIRAEQVALGRHRQNGRRDRRRPC